MASKRLIVKAPFRMTTYTFSTWETVALNLLFLNVHRIAVAGALCCGLGAKKRAVVHLSYQQLRDGEGVDE